MSSPLAGNLAARPANAKVIAVPRDYADIQSAIDAADDGDCVTLSNGVYELEEPLLLHKSIHLISHDESTVSGGVVIKLSSESKKLLRKACHLLVIDSPGCRVAEVCIEHHAVDLPDNDLTFAVYCRGGSVILDQVDVRSDGQSAVGVNENVFATLVRCRFNATQHSVYVAPNGRLRGDRCVFGTSKSLYFEADAYGELDSCRFVGCGIGVETRHPSNVTLQSCVFEDCVHCGVYCSGGQEIEANVACEILECKFLAAPQVQDARAASQQSQRGAPQAEDHAASPPLGLVVDAAKPIVDKSVFIGTMCLITNKGLGTFTNNAFEKTDVAVKVQGRANPLFKFNAFEDCRVGVRVVERLSQGTFTTNEFIGVKTAGEVLAMGNPSFLGNKVSRSVTGFKVAQHGRGAFRGNLVQSCTAAFDITDGADPMLDQNEIEECVRGVTVTRAKAKLLGNRIARSEEMGIELTQADGTWVEDNRITDSGKEGILVTHASTATLLTNTVRGSKLASMQLAEDCKGTVSVQDNRVDEGETAG
eukprot:TRINITY_DN27446_c0_g1_i1.p1 TRINITY_DN27446_c0_g1~~TRINITY_DN27446_c0_g1_i1.p1  ORF type:complete len:533 (+),score=176.31 TRINITY_DN27446_c0_g1_i1:70-1668(+)